MATCSNILSLHAFGLEETNLYDQAEKEAKLVSSNLICAET